MSTEEIAADITKKIVAFLKERGYFTRVRQKDNLTDVAQNLPSMSGGEQPSTPTGTVVAQDGTVVTLGQEEGRKANLASPSNGMNSRRE